MEQNKVKDIHVYVFAAISYDLLSGDLLLTYSSHIWCSPDYIHKNCFVKHKEQFL